FRASDQSAFAPPGTAAKTAANLDALRVLRALEGADRAATEEEQRVLARWAGWGALAHAFDERGAGGRQLHAELAELLTPHELAAARRSTLNAHYTDAGIAAAMWQFVVDLGFDGGRVLEPGCGTGVF